MSSFLNAKLQQVKYKFLPYALLSPIHRFRRDGWNERIYQSINSSADVNVVIFGGYLGTSTFEWLKHLPNSTVDVFEPVPEFADSLQARFASEQVRVHVFGVAEKAEVRNFKILGDATYLENVPRFKNAIPDSVLVPVRFIAVVDLIELLPPRIDVLEINIEGGEYELIPLLSREGILDRVEHLFVQFHRLDDKTSTLLSQVRNDLKRTHALQWKYDFVWEHWLLNK
jgi:FkbM family methyltransferase